MSKITKELKVFISKIDQICLEAKNGKPTDYIAIIDYSLALSFLIYDPEDAKLFLEKMSPRWAKIKEISPLDNEDAQDIINIIEAQLSKISDPEEGLSDNYINHVKKIIKKSSKSLEK
jgi:hypothetical protein